VFVYLQTAREKAEKREGNRKLLDADLEKHKQEETEMKDSRQDINRGKPSSLQNVHLLPFCFLVRSCS
jgi:hypothetical protein